MILLFMILLYDCINLFGITGAATIPWSVIEESHWLSQANVGMAGSGVVSKLRQWDRAFDGAEIGSRRRTE